MEAGTRSEDLFGEAHVKAYQETGGELGYNWKKGEATILLLTTRAARAATPTPLR